MSALIDNILRSFWEWRLQNSPEFATMIGVHKHDDKLDEHSLPAYTRRQEDCKSFIKKLDEVVASTSAGLSKEDLLNVRLLERELETFLDGSQHKSYLFPVTNLEGPQFEFTRTVSWMKFDSKQDYGKYFSRLEAFPAQICQFIELLKEGVRTGYVMPRLTVASVPGQLESALNTSFTDNNALYSPFKKFPDSFGEEERSVLKEKGVQLIEQKLKPAFKELLDYFCKEYIPAARESIACSDLPNGKAFYEQALKFHISCDMTAQQVHGLGLDEVKRIRKRMEEVVGCVGFEGDLQKFFSFLRTDKRFYFDSKDVLMAGYKELCENKIKPKLVEYIKKQPKTAFSIVETPAQSAPVAPAAYYLGPSHDGSRPGMMYVNTYKLDTRPNYEMIPLALHEAEPGHHLQTAFAMEQKSQPSFRTEIEDRRYYEAPARFALHTAYMEGWGLYCEYLGEEMGLYKDPYDLFGRLSMEIVRACRLVVDTGMHALGWSRQKAVNFMADNTAMSLHNVNTEIDRYITWPGQACAYKVGEIKIKELRKKAEDRLGDKFDVRDFHDVFLSAGPMPLDTLEEAVDEYTGLYRY